MAAVADEFGPCAAGDGDGVGPLPWRSVEEGKGAGLIDGAFVEAAVLDEWVGCEERGEAGEGGGEIGGGGDVLGADAVELGVEAREMAAGVHVGGVGFDAAIMPDAGDADLADA